MLFRVCTCIMSSTLHTSHQAQAFCSHPTVLLALLAGAALSHIEHCSTLSPALHCSPSPMSLACP